MSKKLKPKTLPGQETFKGFKDYMKAITERMGIIHLSTAKGRK